LETLIRLSTAHAKSRLSAKVDERDAMAAEEILRFALFKEVLKPEKRKKRKLNTGKSKRSDGSGSDDSDEEDDIDGELDDEVDQQEDVAANASSTATRAAGRAKRTETPREGGPGSVQDEDMDMEAEAALRDVDTGDAQEEAPRHAARGPDVIESER
jgi:DNA replication licensing factor MCM3